MRTVGAARADGSEPGQLRLQEVECWILAEWNGDNAAGMQRAAEQLGAGAARRLHQDRDPAVLAGNLGVGLDEGGTITRGQPFEPASLRRPEPDAVGFQQASD